MDLKYTHATFEAANKELNTIHIQIQIINGELQLSSTDEQLC